MDWFEQVVKDQQDNIVHILQASMFKLATTCSRLWQKPDELDKRLCLCRQKIEQTPCRLLYAMDIHGIQISSNISDLGLDTTVRGQDLSNRPYMEKVRSNAEFILSDVYVDAATRKPRITALQRIAHKNRTLGYLAADFGLNDLPLKVAQQNLKPQWRQIKGDPSIRGTLFMQTRSISQMDNHLSEVLSVIESLICDQGIFHAKLHFSSSRATLWHLDDPYRYNLHVLDEIINPRVCLAYSRKKYIDNAVIDKSLVRPVMDTFQQLREADETIYLRSASLNIMNGLVGLTFSCDGSHYMPVEDFLSKKLDFWFGSRAA
ncbi:MAG: hypothetical protein EP297_05995 [Gammaproteobacteria bacterium]|nr:MAG: hypothetical protein EP297_05995 [Gammaproteobacteria bacterium]